MVIVLGDTHGDLNQVEVNIENKGIADCTIIQVGDFGIGFKWLDEDLQRCNFLNEFLKGKNIMMYAIRGNHDCPFWFNGSKNWSNLKLLPDYSILNIDGDDYFFCGGAISVDRIPRLAEMAENLKYNVDKPNYWPEEVFVLYKKMAATIKGCRYVITHTAP